MNNDGTVNSPTHFVAEVSSNHHQDLKRCLSFIDVAADIGCNGVKFQLFKMEQLFAPEVIAKNPKILERKQWELPLEFLPHLYSHAQKRNIDFSCTPFYLEAVQELYPYVKTYKIASYELLWKELLMECARTGKPVTIATGMATLEEIQGAVETLMTNGCDDLTILHCVSSYPVLAKDCNLSAINTIRDAFGGTKTGWSDHSVQPEVLFRAIHKYNASMIEFHLDIDAKGAEYSSGHCWMPDEIAQVIQLVRKKDFKSIVNWTMADGDGIKIPVASELPDVKWRADPDDGLRPLKELR